MKSCIAGIAAALAMTGASLAAPESSPADDQQICVGGWRFYEATPAELRALRDDPVPPSFRAAIQSRDDCQPYAGLEAALIRQHVLYGDAKSAEAALSFILFAANREAPPSAGELREAARARAKSLSALYAAEKAEAGGAPGGIEAFTKALTAVEPAYEDYQATLTKAALDAAEYFASPPLLARAEELDAIARKAAAATAEAAPDPQPDFEIAQLGWRKEAATDIEQRLAVLKAQMSQKPADIKKANALLERSSLPIFAMEAQAAAVGMVSACDLEKFKDAIATDPQSVFQCEDPDMLARTAQVYWFRRTLIDMLMQDGLDQVDNASRASFETLARRRANVAGMRDPMNDPAMLDQQGLVVLASAQSEMSGGLDYINRDALREAMRATLPFEHPSLWRRMGAAFLDLSEAIAATGHEADAMEAAEIAYVGATLDDLACGYFCKP